jgi:deoxyribodipyrimidine photo-lyase
MAAPILLWFRRDFRLADHPMLSAAAATGRPLIPVFVHDEVVEALGAAPRWRMECAVEAFGARLERMGSGLVLRRGRALDVISTLIGETGADAVWWSRGYDPASKARDAGVKAALKTRGIDARSFPGHLLFEPWTVETGTGGFYRVYSPFWRAVEGRDPGPALAPPGRLPPPEVWPASERLVDWQISSRAMLPSARRLRKRGCRRSLPGRSRSTRREGTFRQSRQRRGCRRTSPTARSGRAPCGMRASARWRRVRRVRSTS